MEVSYAKLIRKGLVMPDKSFPIDVLVFLFRLSPKIMYTIKITMLRWVEIHVISVIRWVITISKEHEL